jgi:outer membrane protein
MVAKSDVLKQQVQVATSRLGVIQSHGDVVNQRAKLAALLGQDPTDDLRASDTLGETPVAFDSVQIYSEALAQRGDLKSSRLAWDAAKTRSSAARAGFIPTLSAAFFYSNSNPNGLVPFSAFTPQPIYNAAGDTIIATTNPTRGVSVSLTVPFFDGIVGRKGTIQEAAARSEQARYAYEKTRLNLEVEIRSTINSARQANEGIEVAKSGLESAQEDLKLSQEKYNVGSGTILDLLDAQVNLQKAQQQYVLALTQARVAEAQIERARGIVP